MTPNKEHRKVFGDNPYILAGESPNHLKVTQLLLKLKVNHLQIIKMRLVVGLGVKFVLLLRKLPLFKTRIKMKSLTLKKGF